MIFTGYLQNHEQKHYHITAFMHGVRLYIVKTLYSSNFDKENTRKVSDIKHCLKKKILYIIIIYEIQ